MAQPVIKTSFASGEWAPKLRGRVDLQKYHAGAALMRNFFVDFVGGGASTRQGTEFVNVARTGGLDTPRLIPFQPSSSLSYILEFGQNYIRFYTAGAPVLENGVAISNVTNANPGVVTANAHGYSNGDEVYLSGMNGMNQLDNELFFVTNATANTFQLNSVLGTAINTTTFNPYISAGAAQRVYTLNSPYNQIDLFPNPLTSNPGLKYVQNATSLIITHPNYPPQVLTELTATNWTLTAVTYTPTIGTPTGLALVSNLPAGTFQYGYLVTAVDANGQESLPSSVITLGTLASIVNTAGTNSLSWTAVPGAGSYNVYRAGPTVTVSIVSGAQYGFVGNVTGTQFTETTPGIAPDFSQGPPLGPSQGSAVKHLTITANGAYTVVPTVTMAAPGTGITAAANATMALATVGISAWVVDSHITSIPANPVNPTGATLTVPGTGGATVRIASATNTSGTLWSVNTVTFSGGSASGAGSSLLASYTPTGVQLSSVPGETVISNSGGVTLTWQIGSFVVTQHGSGYVTAPAVTIAPGPGTALAVIGPTVGGVSINPTASGNPSVCGFFQERLVLAAPPGAIQTYYMSQPGLFYNFSTSFPLQDNDAIQGTIISEDLNDIRTIVNVPTGLVLFTGDGAWLVNGGGGVSVNNPITPANQSASPQAFSGANDLRPLKINYDVIYATNKGNYVRDLSYNIYASIYTGGDISILSNHLFFGYYLTDWCWAEEPFKVVWAVRSDGQLLSMSYVKEQELIGWAHHDTFGLFISTCSVIENVNGNTVDATYFVVNRPTSLGYKSFIERMADRYFPFGVEDSWSVDCAVQTNPEVVSTFPLNFPAFDVSTVGNSGTITSNDGLFTSTMASQNHVLRYFGGVFKITGFTSSTQITATVVRSPNFINTFQGNTAFDLNGYTIWSPIFSMGGLFHLVGRSVIGVADGTAFGPVTVNSLGQVTLPSPGPWTKVTVGLPFTPQLQTLPLDTGEPTVQSKRKKLPAVTLRVADTLGLQIGTTFANAVTMKDFQLGAIPSTSNGAVTVTDLVNLSQPPVFPLNTGAVTVDGRQIMDQVWQEPGQLCIQQNLPYPATIVAVIPELTVGDTGEGRQK